MMRMSSRRDFLQASAALGLSSLFAPNLFARKEVVNPSKATAKQCIFIWMGGGMTHLDTWDPKEHPKVKGEFNAIKTTTDGLQISELFPLVAKQTKHISVIRSLHGTNADHSRASYELQSSFKVQQGVMHPQLGSVISYYYPSTGDLPSYINIGGGDPTPGYLGQKVAPYAVGTPGDPDPYLMLPRGVDKNIQARRLKMLKKRNHDFNDGVLRDAVDVEVERALSLMYSPQVKAFDLKYETPKNLGRYGDSPFGRGLLTAKRLIDEGVSVVRVNEGGFDMHNGIFDAMRLKGPEMDAAIAALIEDLHESGKLESTMVVMMSEFGRTPRINVDGGRDHHAKCFSIMMAGGGVKTGYVHGSSDEQGMHPKDKIVQVPDIYTTIAKCFGIDGNKVFKTPNGRPIHLLNPKGKVIDGLLV